MAKTPDGHWRRFTLADADNAPPSRIEKRRVSDIEFLEWLKTASEADVEKALDDENIPRWRRLALQRTLRKHEHVRAAVSKSEDAGPDRSR